MEKDEAKKIIDYDRQVTMYGETVAKTALQFFMLGANGHGQPPSVSVSDKEIEDLAKGRYTITHLDKGKRAECEKQDLQDAVIYGANYVRDRLSNGEVKSEGEISELRKENEELKRSDSDIVKHYMETCENYEEENKRLTSEIEELKEYRTLFFVTQKEYLEIKKQLTEILGDKG